MENSPVIETQQKEPSQKIVKLQKYLNEEDKKEK